MGGDAVTLWTPLAVNYFRRRQLEPIKPDPAHDALMRVLYQKEPF